MEFYNILCVLYLLFLISGPLRVLRNYHLIMKVGNCILGDLKPALAKALNQILQPVRDHFKNDPKAKELVKRVKSYKVTR
ncbi:tyrosine--tRNA ligase 1, cytoplasmic-like [Olea europaea var. sylvestris]|uniref:tyrosine--tRNA ligase 1, cytoplasmic-like n=1 Tax=Olea europaea var. sylvestris TaxID=158386 RepID=UPI000C1CE9A5|nr:tyrosine--tRNA ligase 1, cytoplasmic-like [Olea europaea var. sylvestris]